MVSVTSFSPCLLKLSKIVFAYPLSPLIPSEPNLCATSASKPAPATFIKNFPETSAESIFSFLPYKIISKARKVCLGIPKNRANPSPDPLGIIPNVLWLAAASSATVFTVPSPPIATNVSKGSIVVFPKS